MGEYTRLRAEADERPGASASAEVRRLDAAELAVESVLPTLGDDIRATVPPALLLEMLLQRIENETDAN